MELELWHIAVMAGAYLVGVSSNVVATVIQRWLHRRYHWWWIEP